MEIPPYIGIPHYIGIPPYVGIQPYWGTQCLMSTAWAPGDTASATGLRRHAGLSLPHPSTLRTTPRGVPGRRFAGWATAGEPIAGGSLGEKKTSGMRRVAKKRLSVVSCNTGSATQICKKSINSTPETGDFSSGFQFSDTCIWVSGRRLP